MGYYLPKLADFTEDWLVVPKGTGTWDVRLSGAYGPCCMTRDGSTLFLYYIGADGDRGDGGPANRALGVATSTDGGKTFSKYGSNPIITFRPNSDDEEGVFSATILQDSGNFYLYYGGLRGTGGAVDIEIRVRNSTDGYTFSNDTLIYDAVGQEHTPFACYKDGSDWYVYYTGALSGGSGPWRLRSGTAWNSLGTDNLIDSGNWEGNGEIAYVDVNNVVVWAIAADLEDVPVAAYQFSKDSPTSVGSVDRLIDWGAGTRKSTLYLDTIDDIWYMAYRKTSDDQIYLRKAKAIRRLKMTGRP